MTNSDEGDVHVLFLPSLHSETKSTVPFSIAEGAHGSRSAKRLSIYDIGRGILAVFLSARNTERGERFHTRFYGRSTFGQYFTVSGGIRGGGQLRPKASSR